MRKSIRAHITSWGWNSAEGVGISVQVDEGPKPVIGRSVRLGFRLAQARSMLAYAAKYEEPPLTPGYSGLRWRAYENAFDRAIEAGLDRLIEEAREAGLKAANFGEWTE